MSVGNSAAPATQQPDASARDSGNPLAHASGQSLLAHSGSKTIMVIGWISQKVLALYWPVPAMFP